MIIEIYKYGLSLPRLLSNVLESVINNLINYTINQQDLSYYLTMSTTRVKPCHPQTTAYTVGCLVKDGQYCDNPSTTALTVDCLIQDGQ